MKERPDAEAPLSDTFDPSYPWTAFSTVLYKGREYAMVMQRDRPWFCSRTGDEPWVVEGVTPSSDAAQQFIFHARVALGIWLDGDGKKKVFEEAIEALDDASVKLEKAHSEDAAPTKLEKKTCSGCGADLSSCPFCSIATVDASCVVKKDSHPEDAPEGPWIDFCDALNRLKGDRTDG